MKAKKAKRGALREIPAGGIAEMKLFHQPALDNYGCDDKSVHPDCPEHGPTHSQYPTPCIETPYRIEEINGELVICSANGFRVAQLIKGAGFPDDNGAFIVRAVNAYDDLLNAVRLARAYMLDETEETDDNVIDCLAETLRKAEEK